MADNDETRLSLAEMRVIELLRPPQWFTLCPFNVWDGVQEATGSRLAEAIQLVGLCILT